jgi:hypothetical protein
LLPDQDFGIHRGTILPDVRASVIVDADSPAPAADFAAASAISSFAVEHVADDQHHP